MRRTCALAAALASGGCLVDNPAFGDASSGGADPPVTTGAPTDATTGPGATTGTTGTTGLDGTGTTGPGTTTFDPTDATTAVDPPPAVQRLQHYTDPARCTIPFWCIDNGLDDGELGPQAGVVCFDAALSPPLRLTDIHYFIRYTEGPAVADFKLVVFAHTGSGPGPAIAERALPDPAWSTPGEHTHVLDPPLALSTASFCVGLAGGAWADSALGIAAQRGLMLPGTSYLWSPPCGVDPWGDLTALNGDPKLSGTYCIDVGVEGP